VAEIARGEEGEDGAEEFALHERVAGVGHLENGGRDEPAGGGGRDGFVAMEAPDVGTGAVDDFPEAVVTRFVDDGRRV
jgi:hypothetical protein